MPTRLGLEDPDLERVFIRASELHQRSAALAAAHAAVAAARLEDPSVSFALGTGLVGTVAALRDALDETYFKLTERSEVEPSLGAGAVSAFHQARAASAVVFLLEGELLESLYESLHSTDDSAAIRRTALRALEAGTR